MARAEIIPKRLLNPFGSTASLRALVVAGFPDALTYVLRVLRYTNGHVQNAAKLLGVSESTLHRWSSLHPVLRAAGQGRRANVTRLNKERVD